MTSTENTIAVKTNLKHDDLQHISWSDDEINEELIKTLDNPLPKAAFETLRTNEKNYGFNNNVGSTWMYPSNLPMRSYQYSITQAALYKNTLVVLPTGLGKTFIAAVVMYNIYRWYPMGKVVFMAPTRPLVAQQIEACKQIMPFPNEDTIELTGKLQREKRMSYWREKRVFFTTPQALQADMISPQGEEATLSNFPFQQIKLIVVDEAHRARGRYAYVEVAQALYHYNKYFRVLALSATPGRSMEDVAEVVRNLYISHLEVRFDTSIDVMQYVHQRSIKTIVVQYSEDIKRIRDEMIKIIDPYMRQLIEADVISGSHQHISRNFLIMEQKRFRERSSYQSHHPQQSAVTSNFSICISLFHALELLERHGLRVFLNSFEDDEDGRPKFVLAMNSRLRGLVEKLRSELGPNPFDVSAHNMTNGCIAEIPKDLDFGHPKFEEARKCILEHFEQNPDSRAIVFCEYRESVMMIYRLLLQHVPIIKPKCFVGQGGTTGALRALSQKQQIQIMNDFRAGKSNLLIATSIGEEGIDVGEVDLILCFDINTSNPIRFVQRIGRTGRQRRGKVIMLVTEGKEQKILQEVLANKDQTNKKLLRSTVVQAALYKHSPRMVPTEFQPECVHIHVRPRSPVVVEKEMSNKIRQNKVKKPSKYKEKLVENTQDLRKFFKKNDLKIDDDDDDDVEDFEPLSKERKQPLKITQNSMERIERLFKDIQPCQNSNTQLMANASTTSNHQLSASTKIKLDTQYLKKINKFLKSSSDTLLPLMEDNLLKHLQSTTCSKAAKLFMLQKSYKQVREICEQMHILEALNVEDVQNMSTHELEIRQTYESILNIFEKEKPALQRFLEDAELDAFGAENKKMARNAALNDTDMTWERYQNVKENIFKGLDLQGANCDSFDYRQKALKQTKAYKEIIAKKSINNLVTDSMIFDAVPMERTFSENDDLEDMTLENLSAFGDSKYKSQCETDFQPNRVNTKSTPINGALAKAFERQRNSQTTVRKKLETVKEQNYEINDDDDDDVIFMPLMNGDGVDEEGSKKCDTTKLKVMPLSQDVVGPPRTIEASFMQRQQSTPIQPPLKKQIIINNIEPSVQHELDLDFEQAFAEPFPEEIEILNHNKIQSLSGSSLKENAEPKTPSFDSKPNKKSTSSIFEMLETKPVNSILTPNRGLITKTMTTTPKSQPMALTSITTPKISNGTDAQITPKLPSKVTPQILDVSGNSTPPSRSIAKQQEATLNFCSPQSVISPETRLQTSTKPYEKSPSIFNAYAKGLQRLESRRKIALVQNASKAAENSDLDSPLIRKRKRTNGQNFKRKIIESDTETDGIPSIKIDSHSRNSDEDFEEVKASPKLKRRCLTKQNSKPMRRARLCEFFDEEAEKSGGSGHSEEDDEENTLGNFVCDSVVIDDEDDVEHENDAPTATQMHAIYLQSVNDTNRCQPGRFKIPAQRNYDVDVYSQAVPAEPSHYGLDSFVVYDNEEEDSLSAGEQTTLCPLEKAELILKQKRREAKRRRCGADNDNENPSKKRARKCFQLNDSSDSDDDRG